MEDKTEVIQVRIDSELKRRFYELAEKNGESPSLFLRSLMRQALERERSEITNLEESKRSTNVILLEILSFLHRRSLLLGNESQWELYKDSFLPEYLEELVGETLHDAGINGDEYWQRYWMEIDKNWFTKFKESPPVVATHLRRDFMDQRRKEIRKQRQPNRPKKRQPAPRNKPR